MDHPTELTSQMLEDTTAELVTKLYNEGWNPTIKVQGLSKEFSIGALNRIMREANNNAFKLMAIANGAAYMRGHEIVCENDTVAAIRINKEGVTRTLLETEDLDN